MERFEKISQGEAKRLFDGAIQEINHKYNGSYDEQIEGLVTSSLTNLTSGVSTILGDQPDGVNTLEWIKNFISQGITYSTSRQEGVKLTMSALGQVTNLPPVNGNTWRSRQIGYMLYPTQMR